MRQPISSLSAIAATAILSLSPVAIANAYPADEGPGSGSGTASSVDVGAARNGGVSYEPDSGAAGRYDGRDLGYNSQPGVPSAPDLGEARNGGIVTPEPAPMTPPAPIDTGIDSETLTIAAGSAAAALVLGIAGFVFMRRRQHNLPHAV